MEIPVTLNYCSHMEVYIECIWNLNVHVFIIKTENTCSFFDKLNHLFYCDNFRKSPKNISIYLSNRFHSKISCMLCYKLVSISQQQPITISAGFIDKLTKIVWSKILQSLLSIYIVSFCMFCNKTHRERQNLADAFNYVKLILIQNWKGNDINIVKQFINREVQLSISKKETRLRITLTLINQVVCRSFRKDFGSSGFRNRHREY